MKPEQLCAGFKKKWIKKETKDFLEVNENENNQTYETQWRQF